MKVTSDGETIKAELDGMTLSFPTNCQEDCLRTALQQEKELPTVRENILDAAKVCVCGQREDDYGTPEDNFGVIAELWTAYTGAKIEPQDVAAMMILLKIGRISSGSRSRDNWIDVAGYAACGGEIVENKCRKEVENGED